jgi:ferredoxin
MSETIQRGPHIDWDKRQALEAEYERSDDAKNHGQCENCQDERDVVLCLKCGRCFRNCHPEDECEPMIWIL